MREPVPLDLSAYQERVRSGECFIGGLVRGDPGTEHELLYDDGVHIAFLNRYPTLPGYTLVAPRRHVVDVVRELTTAEYLALQTVVHAVALAVPRADGGKRDDCSGSRGGRRSWRGHPRGARRLS